MKSLLENGDFTLSSGRQTDWRLNCEYLTENDLNTIAFLFSKILPVFGICYGIPRGGLALSRHLMSYRTEGNSSVLVCDDVWTTGKSFYEFTNGRPVIGAVIFARGQTPENVYSLFNINESLKINV